MGGMENLHNFSLFLLTIKMVNINLFRTNKNNDPEILRELQRKWYKSVELIDNIVSKNTK